jgi:hypothetical protein
VILLPVSDPPDGFNTWACHVCGAKGQGNGAEHFGSCQALQLASRPEGGMLHAAAEALREEDRFKTVLRAELRPVLAEVLAEVRRLTVERCAKVVQAQCYREGAPCCCESAAEAVLALLEET